MSKSIYEFSEIEETGGEKKHRRKKFGSGDSSGNGMAARDPVSQFWEKKDQSETGYFYTQLIDEFMGYMSDLSDENNNLGAPQICAAVSLLNMTHADEVTRFMMDEAIRVNNRRSFIFADFFDWFSDTFMAEEDNDVVYSFLTYNFNGLPAILEYAGYCYDTLYTYIGETRFDKNASGHMRDVENTMEQTMLAPGSPFGVLHFEMDEEIDDLDEGEETYEDIVVGSMGGDMAGNATRGIKSWLIRMEEGRRDGTIVYACHKQPDQMLAAGDDFEEYFLSPDASVLSVIRVENGQLKPCSREEAKEAVKKIGILDYSDEEYEEEEDDFSYIDRCLLALVHDAGITYSTFPLSKE